MSAEVLGVAAYISVFMLILFVLPIIGDAVNKNKNTNKKE